MSLSQNVLLVIVG